MPRYFVELTENERLFLIMACGAAHNIPGVVSSQGDPPAIGIEIARRLVSITPGAAASPAPTAAPQPQGQVQPSAPAKPRAIPGDAKELHILPFSITKTGEGEKERLVVQGKSGGVTKKASCWANCRDIWPRVLEKVKQPATFLVVEKSGYLNIVGVK